MFEMIRIQTWQDLTGREIKFVNMDVAKEYDLLLKLFKDFKPDTVSLQLQQQ